MTDFQFNFFVVATDEAKVGQFLALLIQITPYHLHFWEGQL